MFSGLCERNVLELTPVMKAFLGTISRVRSISEKQLGNECIQRQVFTGILENICTKTSRNIHRETRAIKSFF